MKRITAAILSAVFVISAALILPAVRMTRGAGDEELTALASPPEMDEMIYTLMGIGELQAYYDNSLGITYSAGTEYDTLHINAPSAFNDTVKTIIVLKPDADLYNLDPQNVIALKQDSNITSVNIRSLDPVQDAGTYTVLMGGNKENVYTGTFVIGSASIGLIIGDSNLNGELATNDASFILRRIAGFSTGTSNVGIECTINKTSGDFKAGSTIIIGDTDYNGVISTIDVIHTLRKIAGFSTVRGYAGEVVNAVAVDDIAPASDNDDEDIPGEKPVITKGITLDAEKISDTEYNVTARYVGFDNGISGANLILDIPEEASVNVSTPISGWMAVLNNSEGQIRYAAANRDNEEPDDNVIAIFNINLNSPLTEDFSVKLKSGSNIDEYDEDNGEFVSVRGDELVKSRTVLKAGGSAPEPENTKEPTPEPEYTKEPTPLPAASEEPLRDGATGTSGGYTWVFSGDTLYLSGTGNMADYEAGKAPWYSGRGQIKHVIFSNDTAASVGANAFRSLYALEDVKFPAALTAIGDSAFEGCESLKAISLPEAMSGSISTRAFAGCASLREINIPNVLVIGEGAFEGCSAIERAVLPFVGARQGDRSTRFEYIFGIVPEALKSVTITNETFLPEGAFEGLSGIEAIDIQSKLTDIGARAFYGCESLKSFKINDGITAIRDYTFADCAAAESIEVPDTVKEIGVSAFENCVSLKAVNVPDGVKAVQDYTFKNCKSLTSIEIPSTVQSIGRDALAGCVSLRAMKLPFVGANADPGIMAPTDEGVLGYLFGEAERGTIQNGKTYAVPASLTKVEIINSPMSSYIPPHAFEGCANIADIIIDGGKNVCESAFLNCRNLTNLYIPQTVDSIEADIMRGCYNLETLTVPFIGKNRLDNNNPTSVLGYFFGMDEKKSKSTDVEQVYNESGGSYFYHVPDTLKKVSVINQTNIPYGAFMQCYSLEQVTIVTGAVMRDMAFYNCSSLKKLVLPSDLQEIGARAFAECSRLETINIPAGAESIGDYAFYNCRSLMEITIPRTVTNIADRVFNGTNLMSVSDGKLTIICSEGSKAHEFAAAKGIDCRLVDESELNIKKTSTNVSALSDNSYMFDIIDPYRMNGTLNVELYDAGGNMLRSKTMTAGNSEYRVMFSGAEMANVSYAKVYITGSGGESVTTSDEVISSADGDIPEIVSDISISYDNGVVTFNGTMEIKAGSALIEAVYNSDNTLERVIVYSVNGASDKISVDTSFSGGMKLLLWDSLQTMKPLADAVIR